MIFLNNCFGAPHLMGFSGASNYKGCGALPLQKIRYTASALASVHCFVAAAQFLN